MDRTEVLKRKYYLSSDQYFRNRVSPNCNKQMCEICKKESVIVMMIQSRSADEPSTEVRKCINCNS